MKELDLEKLAEIAGDSDLSLCDELYRFSRLLIKNFDLRLFFENPQFPKEAKLKMLSELLPGVSSRFRDLIGLLLDEGLEKRMIKISEAFSKVVSRKRGAVFAQVESAYPVAPQHLERIRAFIGKKVVFRQEIDPHLIGGVKVLTSDGLFFDASLTGVLARLEEDLVHA